MSDQLQSKPFTFRLHPLKDKEVWDEIHRLYGLKYELREIVTDRILRFKGVTPEMFHKNARAITLGDMEHLLGEAVQALDNPLAEILERVSSYQQQLEEFMENQRQVTHRLFEQIAAGEISLEQAAETYDTETDEYATKLMNSLDNRYSD